MKTRILVADDHPIVRDGVRLVLSSQPDLQVVGEAANGHEVLRQVRRLQPDIVIMDISMPQLNGIEATRQLKEIQPQLKTMILSMYSTPHHILRALQAGAKAYLLKERASAEIVQALQAVRVDQRYLSPPIRAYIEEIERRRTRWDRIDDPLSRLSSREREVLQLVVEGKSSVEAAEILSISAKTVETYRSRLMHKLPVTSLAGLVKFAVLNGVTGLDQTRLYFGPPGSDEPLTTSRKTTSSGPSASSGRVG